MPRPSWELSNNNAFHGYLKFLDFQNNVPSVDLHATFEKSPQRVHVSIYDTGGAKKLRGSSIWLASETTGLCFSGMDFYIVVSAVGCGQPTGPRLPTVPGYKNYEEFFLYEVNEKARELGFIAQKPGHLPINNQPKIVASDFPSLS